MPGLSSKSMFGGQGIWQHGVFFAIVFKDRLYFRTGPETIGDYLDAGMKAFTTDDFVSTNYYEVPGDVQASGTALRKWAIAAVQEAMKVKRHPKKRRRA